MFIWIYILKKILENILYLSQNILYFSLLLVL